MYAPCHKSCPLSAFEIVEKSDKFCGKEHTYKILRDYATILHVFARDHEQDVAQDHEQDIAQNLYKILAGSCEILTRFFQDLLQDLARNMNKKSCNE
jgi:hypothetical protein